MLLLLHLVQATSGRVSAALVVAATRRPNGNDPRAAKHGTAGGWHGQTAVLLCSAAAQRAC